MQQKFRFLQSLTLSTLLEHLGVVQSATKHVVIDCLSNIVHSLMLGVSSEATITEGMKTLGEAIRIMVSRNPDLRVYIAQPVPRRSAESKEACVIALVIHDFNLFWLFRKKITFLFQRVLVSILKLVPTAWVLSWATTLDIQPTGILSDSSCRQFLEELIRCSKLMIKGKRSLIIFMIFYC